MIQARRGLISIKACFDDNKGVPCWPTRHALFLGMTFDVLIITFSLFQLFNFSIFHLYRRSVGVADDVDATLRLVEPETTEVVRLLP